MSDTGYIRGRPAFWDGEVWRWQDTEEPAGPVWGGVERPCPKCGEMATPEGYDPCIGHDPGASSVCCGHGLERPSIKMVDPRAEKPRPEILDWDF
jgi:hypothetical protein